MRIDSFIEHIEKEAAIAGMGTPVFAGDFPITGVSRGNSKITRTSGAIYIGYDATLSEASTRSALRFSELIELVKDERRTMTGMEIVTLSEVGCQHESEYDVDCYGHCLSGIYKFNPDTADLQDEDEDEYEGEDEDEGEGEGEEDEKTIETTGQTAPPGMYKLRMGDLDPLSQARKAITHVLIRIGESPEISWYLGHGTESYALLIEAAATLLGISLETALDNFKPAKTKQPNEN